MSNISGQLIKDSYNYVLQSDLATGIVYRIGGAVPINPIFSSGLTILSSFRYQDGSESNGYVLTSDANGNATWQPISGGTGGTTVTGGTFNYSASTLTLNNSDGSSVLINGLHDYYITAFTYNNNTFTLSDNSGNTFNATINTLTGLTITGNLEVDYIDFTLTANPAHREGRLHWNDDQKTLDIDTDENGFMIEVGHMNVVRVVNKTNTTLLKGEIVWINGAQGQRPTVTRASYEGDGTSARTLGFVAQNISNNNNGYVITYGMLRDVNTSPYSAGTQLYLYTGGTWTNVRPIAPKHEVRVGVVITQNATTGIIFVSIMNGYELTELHDVSATTVNNLDILQYNLSQKVWQPTSNPVFNSLSVQNGISANTVTAITYYGDGSNLTGIPRAGGGTGGQIYYLNISNTQSPYYEFSPSGTTAPEQIISATTGSSQTAYIGGFLTPSNLPNLIDLPIGIIGFYLHARTGSIGASFNIYAQLYKRTTGGTETLLFTSDSVPVASTTTQMYVSDGYFSGATLNSTDRLLVKVYATNTSAQPETIFLHSEGSNHYSFCVTTIPSFTDTFVTGLTFSNNVLTLDQNNGKLPLTANINSYEFYYQNTAPAGTGTSSIDEGATWVHSETGVEYKYNYDGNSYQWVQQTLPVGPQGPQGANGTNNIDSGTTTTFNGVLIGNGVVVSASSITNIIGYTPENVANKETVALDNSNTKYPTNNVVNTALQSFSDEVDYATMINQRLLFNY